MLSPGRKDYPGGEILLFPVLLPTRHSGPFALVAICTWLQIAWPVCSAIRDGPQMCLDKRQTEERDTEKAGETVKQPQPRMSGAPSIWGMKERDSPLEPSEGAQSCQYLGFGLLASRTVREYISAVYATRCGNLLWLP